MTQSVFSIPLIGNLPLGACDVADALAAQEASARPAPKAALKRPGAAGTRNAHNQTASKSLAIKAAAETATAFRCEYIAGAENRLISEAIGSLLGGQRPTYNPLVIVGPPGVGKTHLARGLAAAWRQRQSEAASIAKAELSVVYATCADFAHLLKAAIDRRQTAEFRERFRELSLLVLDDLTQLATRCTAQLELLHTLDAVTDSGGQVVVTTRLSPDKIDALDARLASRLAAGLTVAVGPPAAAARLALVERFAAMRQIDLTEAAARLLAESLPGTVADLSGAVLELSSGADYPGATIDLAAVRQYLNERQARLRPSLKIVTAAVAKYYGLATKRLVGKERNRIVAQARNVAVYLGRELTAKSLPQLGAFFGGRDHTTILHSFQVIDRRQRSDSALRRVLSELRAAISGM